MPTDEAVTKRDIENLGRDLRQFILEREVASIRWFVGTQIAYCVLTLGAVYFLITQFVPHVVK